MSAAERKRRERARRRAGVHHVARIPVDWDMIETLLDHKWLKWNESEDAAQIDAALVAALLSSRGVSDVTCDSRPFH